MGERFLRCRAPDCRRWFRVSEDELAALREARQWHRGLKLPCPTCRLVLLYRADQLYDLRSPVETVAHPPAPGAVPSAFA